jgi:hypothetical protein
LIGDEDMGHELEMGGSSSIGDTMLVDEDDKVSNFP